MNLILQAACCCKTGKVRKNNEDNFYFDGKCLEMDNNGLKHVVCMEEYIRSGICLAIFDGMGGEHYGEHASYIAARKMQSMQRALTDYFIPERQLLQRLAMELNDAVVQEQKKLLTSQMGTTMVSLYFTARHVYVCNVGDSRAYRLRNGEFMQLSEDHTAKRPGDSKNAPLTQYLGIDSEELQIDPYIAKGSLEKGDLYLLCSDGLTDMLTNFEIADIMLKNQEADACAYHLIRVALEHGGRDNITVIVCKIV